VGLVENQVAVAIVDPPSQLRHVTVQALVVYENDLGSVRDTIIKVMDHRRLTKAALGLSPPCLEGG
jgi:hypothetical protein